MTDKPSKFARYRQREAEKVRWMRERVELLESALLPFAEAYNYFGMGKHAKVNSDDLKRAWELATVVE